MKTWQIVVGILMGASAFLSLAGQLWWIIAVRCPRCGTEYVYWRPHWRKFHECGNKLCRHVW
jgi:hypothetical protein